MHLELSQSDFAHHMQILPNPVPFMAKRINATAQQRKVWTSPAQALRHAIPEMRAPHPVEIVREVLVVVVVRELGGEAGVVGRAHARALPHHELQQAPDPLHMK